MIFEDGDRIVFAGDSVTDMGSAQPVGEGLFDNVGRSYVRIVENMLAAVYPERRIRVTNSGVGGNTREDWSGPSTATARSISSPFWKKNWPKWTAAAAWNCWPGSTGT